MANDEIFVLILVSICVAVVVVMSFRSRRPRTPTAGQGFMLRSPLPDMVAWRRPRISQVPEESLCAYALLFDPGRTGPSGLTT